MPFVDELIGLAEADRQSTHSNMLLNSDHAAASLRLYWMFLMICTSSALRLVMTSSTWRVCGGLADVGTAL